MKKHLYYYVTLLAAVGVAILLELQHPQQKQTQMTIVVGLGVVYALWGMMHHMVHHSLRAKIVLEYVAIASLGIVTILFIVNSIL